jgi:predicted ArsR family transcriptional regulator
MLLPVFQDLIKPQWRKVLEELKISGSLSVGELARRLDVSYMAVKQHCEELKKIGYLGRTRMPRKEVGRPEIFYQLTAKADGLFPQAGVDFTLEILDELKARHGESFPDKLLFQYFEKRELVMRKKLEKCQSLVEKATKLAGLRTKDGYLVQCKYDPQEGFRMEEYHNPLQRVFEQYPRAVAMELRMLEQLLGTPITRRERPRSNFAAPRVTFDIPTLGVR